VRLSFVQGLGIGHVVPVISDGALAQQMCRVLRVVMFDFSLLSDFRARLQHDDAALTMF
jgi:hypothetical protein